VEKIPHYVVVKGVGKVVHYVLLTPGMIERYPKNIGCGGLGALLLLKEERVKVESTVISVMI